MFTELLRTIINVLLAAIAPSHVLMTMDTYIGDSACAHGHHPLDNCQDCDAEYDDLDIDEIELFIMGLALTNALLSEEELKNLVDARRAEIACDWEIERSGGLHV